MSLARKGETVDEYRYYIILTANWTRTFTINSTHFLFIYFRALVQIELGGGGGGGGTRAGWFWRGRVVGG